jgi:hypothetical protein
MPCIVRNPFNLKEVINSVLTTRVCYTVWELSSGQASSENIELSSTCIGHRPETLTTLLRMGPRTNTTLEVLESTRNVWYDHEEEQQAIHLPLEPLAQGLQHVTSLRVLNVKDCCLHHDKQLVDSIRDSREHPLLRESNLSSNVCRSQGMLQLAAFWNRLSRSS